MEIFHILEPAYISFPHVTKDGSRAVISYQHSFTLNSQLQEYVVYANGQIIFQGTGVEAGLERQTKTQGIQFFHLYIIY